MSAYQKVILLVDDDPEDQFLVSRAFSSVKPSVAIQTLNDGDEVIPALTATDSLPELIILDINMMRMDGLQTLAALREAAPFRTIPVVLLTTSDNPKDRELSQTLGARAYYVKPFHYKDMVNLATQLANTWLA
jgi:CheY-like chemotaxis protein